MLSRISNLGGGNSMKYANLPPPNLEKAFVVENAISNLPPICGVENLGWKMLSRIWEKFGVENAISNLEFGGAYLESRIFVVENSGCHPKSRVSHLGGGKFGVENANPNLEFGGWKIWGGKCYIESRIWGVENLNLEFGVVENLGWKMLSRTSNLGGGKFGVENAIPSNLPPNFGGSENLGWKISRISNLGGGKCYLESRIFGGGKFEVENAYLESPNLSTLPNIEISR